MSEKIFFFIVTLLFHRSSCYNLRSLRKHIVTLQKPNFEFFIFAATYPVTNYWNLNKKWEAAATFSCHPSDIPLKNNWSIHGLWPSSHESPYINDCNKLAVDFNSFEPSLIAELKEKWRSHKSILTNENFWNHEYKKHGTCALAEEKTNTAVKYFSSTLKLLDRYNAGEILQKANIHPGGKYKLDEIDKAFRDLLNVQVDVICKNRPRSEEQYLSEIWLCLDKTFTPIDCHRNDTDTGTTCNSDNYVIYPKQLDKC